MDIGKHLIQAVSRRLHYTFSRSHSLHTLEFTIFRPAGNDTGLFSGIIRDFHQRKIIADALQQTFPNVEQVGFVNLDPNNAELLMAGGEFCANATSSAAYQILRGEPGKILIKVSGVKKKLLAGVTKDGQGFSQVPIYPDPGYVTHDLEHPGNFLINMEGITHYIDFDINQIKGLTEEEIKIKARKEMSAKGIDHNLCCGIIYVEQLKERWAIHPIVYIRDVDTLYYETACGSGTTALGLVLSLRSGKSIKEIPVIQPSGLTINVSVEFDGISFGYAQIQSFVKELEEGKLSPYTYKNVQVHHHAPRH